MIHFDFNNFMTLQCLTIKHTFIQRDNHLLDVHTSAKSVTLV